MKVGAATAAAAAASNGDAAQWRSTGNSLAGWQWTWNGVAGRQGGALHSPEMKDFRQPMATAAEGQFAG